MTGPFPFHPTRVGVALLTASTTYLTLRSWSGIAGDPGAFLTPLLWICLLLALSGLVLRSLRVPAVGVVAVQVLLVVLVLNNLWAGSVSPLGWLPTLESLRRDITVLAEAGQAAQEWSTPVPANVVAFPPLLVGVGAVLALVVEVLVGTVRRVPLAGLPLIAALTVPVSLLGGVPLFSFALAAVSFALLMAAEQTLRVGQWGLGHWGGQRDDEDRHSDTEVGLPSTLPPALGVGVAGVLVAVVAPILLPSGLGLLERFGSGGSGDGTGGPLELSNPMLNMQRDLVQGSNDPVLQIATTDPSPDYLRLTVLDEFDGDAWRPSERDIPPTNQADERLPQPPGLDNATPKQAYRTSMVATEDFESQWLPTPYPAIDVSVSGDWRYDSETLDIVGSETTFTQAEVTGLEVRPDAADLVDAPLPPRGIERLGTELPDEMPDIIERTAEEVTEGATSDFERIVMLQRWFREEGGFEYTTSTSSGNGLEQIETFLGDGDGSREGYCEQFATALALMARTLDIPARVSVGFLRPERVGDGAVGLQQPRPARLAGDLLRGGGLDAVRPHAVRPGPSGAGVHQRPAPQRPAVRRPHRPAQRPGQRRSARAAPRRPAHRRREHRDRDRSRPRRADLRRGRRPARRAGAASPRAACQPTTPSPRGPAARGRRGGRRGLGRGPRDRARPRPGLGRRRLAASSGGRPADTAATGRGRRGVGSHGSSGPAGRRGRSCRRQRCAPVWRPWSSPWSSPATPAGASASPRGPRRCATPSR